MIALLVAVFILSGAAGLIYESIWSRYLGLFVGHSAYAQIIVLVIFLGGMSLGAHLAGRWSERIRSPLIWYAAIELMVGILALLFHQAFEASTTLAYSSIFPALSGVTLTIVKWTIASLLILPQSVLLGATFPLMSAGVIRVARAQSAPGRILGLLYFANSLGAAVGVLIAGFVLIEMMGLPGTLIVAGLLNVIAGLVVGLIGRAEERSSAAAAEAAATSSSAAAAKGDAAAGTFSAAPAAPVGGTVRPPRSSAESRLSRALLIVAFGTAVASFVYEIAWIRMLSLVLGSATHSFELMLSAFIFGLAVGAFWVRGRADRLRDPVRFLGYVQWVMGLLAVATLPLYVESFEWMGSLLRTLQRNESGYQAFLLSRYGIALTIMLPATFCAGMTLPLITRVLMRAGEGERAIGAVYAVNTLGSIAGVILAGLVLMPLLGIKLLLVFGALIDMALGVWLVVRSPSLAAAAPAPSIESSGRQRRWPLDRGPTLAIQLVATTLFLFAVALGARFDLGRLTSGVYRHGALASSAEYTFPYYRDGRTASVSMRRGLDGFLTLGTNGKPDASMERTWYEPTTSTDRLQLTRDQATQLLLPMITLAHAPRAQNAAVIGFGSGMSSHVLLGSPHVREVVTIEIEPEMIRASRLFQPANKRVYEDRRSTFIIDDAKSYFAASARKFDLILSEPSNPWVSGVSGLFTEEFYRRVQTQLSDSGVFGQWLHLYELSDGLVNSVLAALDGVFPHYEIFYTSNADILAVASNRPLPNPDWEIIKYPGISQDLRRIAAFPAEAFEALRLAGRNVLHPFLLSQGAANSDYFPVLDLGAERWRFMRRNAGGYETLADARFDVVAALSGRRADFSTLAVTPTPEISRSRARSLGSQLRAMRVLPPAMGALLPRDNELRAALYRVDQLDRVMASGRAPADWHAWMDAVVDVDADLHSGTAGVVDTAWFDRLRRYTERTGAPLEARASVIFLHGIGAWNWPEAALAARALMTSKDTAQWLPAVLLRNGAAVAFTMLRDTTGVQEVLREFAKRTNEDRFREMLIASYFVYQDTTLRRRRGWK